MTLPLNASAITRRLSAAGIYVVSGTRPSGAVRVVPIPRAGEDAVTLARRVSALLLQAGYETTRVQIGTQPGDAVLVTLPEPIDLDAVEQSMTREHRVRHILSDRTGSVIGHGQRPLIARVRWDDAPDVPEMVSAEKLTEEASRG